MGKRRVLITGAAGGMGRACARLLGVAQELVLTDRQAPPLAAFAEELRLEGYDVAGVHPGDLRDDALLRSLAQALTDAPFTLVHTAGLSPSLADWREIMDVNLVATEKLLRAVEPQLQPGSVAVLISSAAGYRISVPPEAQALLADPLQADFLDRIGALIASMTGAADAEGRSYSLSKNAVHRICERRAAAWGARGARIVSVSPTLSLTPMGRQEIAKTPAAAAFVRGAPLGRMGTAMDVAAAVRFLTSDDASFISGCDLRVDGGSLASTLHR